MLALAALADTGHAAETLPRTANLQLPYPVEVSLVRDRMGWTFQQSPSGLPLYIYEADSPGKSACNGACAKKWPPLIAPKGETSVGEWTIFVRTDGRRQWEFKGRPVYTHVPDKRAVPSGEGGLWKLMPHFHSQRR